MNRFTTWSDPRPDQLGDSAVALLRNLGGPGAIHVRGEDQTRTRVIVTLLHGNEPSGVRAMHAWLQRRHTPRVNCVWIVGAVDAALEPPGFAHRQLPGRPDLNRCFRDPFLGPEGKIAAWILELLERHRPEAVLDLHNNTGHNPPYGIATRADGVHLGLCAWFARRLVHSHLDLGALVEVTNHGAPSVTIECGLAGDPDADRVALRGVDAFLASDSIVPMPTREVEVFEDPTRVTLRSDATLAIAGTPSPTADLTLAAEIDRHNWRTVPPETTIGWTSSRNRWPVEARSGEGPDISRELFSLEDGTLRTRRPMIPIMITTDAGIAASDCLFYVVRARQQSSERDDGGSSSLGRRSDSVQRSRP